MAQRQNDPSEKPESRESAKSAYRKPTIRTESLTAVAAVCNGVSGGGRKSSTTSIPSCNSTKLKS